MQGSMLRKYWIWDLCPCGILVAFLEGLRVNGDFFVHDALAITVGDWTFEIVTRLQ